MRLISKPIFIYFASPYTSDDPEVVAERVAEIRAVVAKVINNQNVVIPYSPIVYTHDLAEHCPDHDWYEWDLHFLERCDAMIVVKMTNWKRSKGVQKEIDYCRKHNIPYAFAKPENILEVCERLAEDLLRERIA